MTLPAAYLESRRYQGAALQHQRTEEPIACALQPRDIALIHDVSRYHFLTSNQLRELWWPAATAWAANRRLRKLFDAGYLDRFRPISTRGSFPWTYQLAAGGHRLLQEAGHVDRRQRFNRRAVYDYSYVVHDLQLNSWVLAYRAGIGSRLESWEGETEIMPPANLRKAQPQLGGNWTADGLADARPRMVRPDAVLTIAAEGESAERVLLIEYDRTRRADKNFEKFRRYDSFLTWWWKHTACGHADEPPYVLFVCQDDKQRDKFLVAADRELTGHRWHPDVPLIQHHHTGRQHLLFTTELAAYENDHQALRVPTVPPRHPLRQDVFRRVRLPGGHPLKPAAQRELDLDPSGGDTAPSRGDVSRSPIAAPAS